MNGLQRWALITGGLSLGFYAVNKFAPCPCELAKVIAVPMPPPNPAPPETLRVGTFTHPDPNPYGRDFYEGLYPDSIRKYVDSMEPHPIWWWPVDEYGYPLTRDSVEALGIDAESFLAR